MGTLSRLRRKVMHRIENAEEISGVLAKSDSKKNSYERVWKKISSSN